MRSDIDESLTLSIGNLADLLNGLIEIPFFLGKDRPSHHEQQQEELRIKVTKQLLDNRICDE